MRNIPKPLFILALIIALTGIVEAKADLASTPFILRDSKLSVAVDLGVYTGTDTNPDPHPNLGSVLNHAESDCLDAQNKELIEALNAENQNGIRQLAHSNVNLVKIDVNDDSEDPHAVTISPSLSLDWYDSWGTLEISIQLQHGSCGKALATDIQRYIHEQSKYSPPRLSNPALLTELMPLLEKIPSSFSRTNE